MGGSRGGVWARVGMAALVIAACSKGSGGAAAGGDGGSDAGSSPYLAVSANVSASAGGSLTAPDGATLVIPPGALQQDSTITLTMPSDQTAASRDHWYEIAPSMTLNAPATLTAPVPSGTDPYVVLNVSTANALVDDGVEQSRWIDATIAAQAANTVSVSLPHFTGVGLLEWVDEPAYLVVDVPGQYLEPGDLLITLSAEHPGFGTGSPNWFPGHVGIFTGVTGRQPIYPPGSAGADTTDPPDIVESVKTGVSDGTLANFRTGYGQDHLYLGPRVPCSNGLTPSEQQSVTNFVIAQRGKPYNLVGDASHVLASLLALTGAKVLGAGGFSCVGLADAAYDSVDKSPISLVDRHLIAETPRDMYRSTCPVTSITVHCGDHLRIPVYGAVVNPESKVGVGTTLMGYYTQLQNLVSGQAGSTYEITANGMPEGMTFQHDDQTDDGYVLDWVAGPVGTATVVNVQFTMTAKAQATRVGTGSAVDLGSKTIQQALQITVQVDPSGACDAGSDAEAGACLVLGNVCAGDAGACCSGLACPSYALSCCIPTQASGCTNSNDCCLSKEFNGTAPGGAYCTSTGTCCGMTPSQSGLANAPCATAADCCSGPCTAFGPGPDAGGVPGYCCLPYQSSCTITNGKDDCCDNPLGQPVGCSAHPNYTGMRCCIPDGIGSHPCSVPWAGDQGCCSGHCDTSSGMCCTPLGAPCDTHSGCCGSPGHGNSCGTVSGVAACCVPDSGYTCGPGAPCCDPMQCTNGACCAPKGASCTLYQNCCAGSTCGANGTCQ